MYGGRCHGWGGRVERDCDFDASKEVPILRLLSIFTSINYQG
jgi:hypothetical protein